MSPPTPAEPPDSPRQSEGSIPASASPSKTYDPAGLPGSSGVDPLHSDAPAASAAAESPDKPLPAALPSSAIFSAAALSPDAPASHAAPPAARPPAAAPPTAPMTAASTLAAALVTTVVVTVASYFAPEKYAATAVGLVFLAATWALVLRRDEHTIRAYGLSLGGVLEPAPIELSRLLRGALVALAWLAALCAIAFPLFWLGYRAYWHVRGPFVLRLPPSILDELAGQLLVIALPEEAFFRGFLQTSLDAAWPPRWRILGAHLGPGWIVSAAIFAAGHILTTPHPARLAVFFPALLFGWLRARTGSIAAPVLFHAACNIFSATLARGYGLTP